MDCPYYEQLQYFGDARIQAMITMFNTRDDRLVRCALEQGRRSLVPDGITMSRYPSSLPSVHPRRFRCGGLSWDTIIGCTGAARSICGRCCLPGGAFFHGSNNTCVPISA